MLRPLLQRDPVIIQPYRGYASSTRLYLRGRILEDENIISHREEGLLNTIRDNFKRWESDEIPGVPVRLKVDGQIYTAITDKEGYFIFDKPHAVSLPDEAGWKTVDLDSSFKYHGRAYKLQSTAQIYLPSQEADFGIITDVDDTILQTDVLFRLKLLRNTFMKSPFKREEVTGMSTWVRALHEKDTNSSNPIFYVSKSPRNIFDYLTIFLDANHFPKGPLMLRDFGRQGAVRPENYLGHKEDEIERILTTYPDLRFILLGDIAGRDPQIYHYIQEKYPNRILAIYIKDIDHRRKQKIFRAWMKMNKPPNVILMKTAAEGAAHAFSKRWISKKNLGAVIEEVNSHES